MIADYAFFLIFSLICIFLIAAAFTSFVEKEPRAGWLFILCTFVLAIIFSTVILFYSNNEQLKWILILTFLCTILLLFLPIRRNRVDTLTNPLVRYDEADAVLSRRLLVPGSEAYKDYYSKHPDRKAGDDKARKNPGLLSSQSKFFEPLSFAASKANFDITEHLHSVRQTINRDVKTQIDKSTEARFIKHWLKRTGAYSVGITTLKPYHLYSRKGRGPRRGEILSPDLPLAIVILTEMDHSMMRQAPGGATVMESAEQYLRSGILASKLTRYIHHRGYKATAHTDGNYEVICPLVAQDAGLGVIGRMGLLMTPGLGPRVRISVVTTDIPLQTDKQKPDLTPIDFCKKCKKCADICPVKAISADPMKNIDGVNRWQINSEKCYHYWTIAGTDCGQCVISCPYSHPDNWLHRFIRFSIANNLVFQNLARKLDDIFYGRYPAKEFSGRNDL